MKRQLAILAMAVALAIPAEGLRLTPYLDPAGILTNCYGHTGPDVKPGLRLTLEQCNALLDEDMLKAIAIVEKCHPGLPEPVTAAFADTVFNSGPKIACDRKNSTAARLLDKGDLVGACNQLPRWNKVKAFGIVFTLPGLTTRRIKARDICLTGT